MIDENVLEHKKIPVYEVNNEGFIIEYYSLTLYEIGEMEDEGYIMITKDWHEQRLFTPRWDFEQKQWVEGLTPEEVEEKETVIQEQNSKMSSEDINAIAMMELAQKVYGEDV